MPNDEFIKSISNPKVYQVFRDLDRAYFINSEHKQYADYDVPLSIGYGQTISQPSLVALMIDWLRIEDYHKILEIGTGSGYQTAFLSKLAKYVYTVEVIEVLSQTARQSLKKAGLKNISYKVGDGSQGWEEYAPYDRIIASAASREVPPPLLDQLAINGRLIIPVGEKGVQDLLLVVKESNGHINKQVLDKVMFVEFVGQYGWS